MKGVHGGIQKAVRQPVEVGGGADRVGVPSIWAPGAEREGGGEGGHGGLPLSKQDRQMFHLFVSLLYPPR